MPKRPSLEAKEWIVAAAQKTYKAATIATMFDVN